MIGGLVLAGGLALLAPAPRWVERTCTLEAEARALVRVAESGVVKTVLRVEGEAVRAGDAVAILENRDLRDLASAQAARLARAEAELSAAMAQGSAEAVGAARAARAAARAQLDATQRRLDTLVLRAGEDGTVATRDLARAKGRLARAGEVFCVVRPARAEVFTISLGEKEARLVRSGARVRLRVPAYADRKFTGVVEAAPLRTPPVADSAKVASPAAEEATHYVTVRITETDAALRIGLSGRVRIECGRAPVAWLLLEKAWDFLRLDLRMR